jgi:hypothetical protein
MLCLLCKTSNQFRYLWYLEMSIKSIKYLIMNYTVKIAENEMEGENLIRKIKELVGNSPFVSIYEEETGLSDDMVQELERRYQHVVKNPQDGESWEEVKKDLLNR